MKPFIECPIVTYPAITQDAISEFRYATAPEKRILMRVLYDLLANAVCFPEELQWDIPKTVQLYAQERCPTFREELGPDATKYYLTKTQVACYALSHDWPNLANVEFPICVDVNYHLELRGLYPHKKVRKEVPNNARYAYWEAITFQSVWSGPYLDARIALLRHMIANLKELL